MNNPIIHTLFERTVERFPHQTAVVAPSGNISYYELNSQANRLAHRLLRNNADPESIVGVMLDPGIGLVQTMLAIFKSGYVYLPLDINFTDRRFSEIFTISPCRTLIVSRKFQPLIDRLLNRIDVRIEEIIFLDDELLPIADHNPDKHIQPDAGLYIVYTSGSTGEGKAILGCQQSLSHFIQWEIEEFSVDHTARVSQLSQVTFDASFRDVLVPLCAGGTLYIPSQDIKSDILRLMEWITISGITLMHCVPSLFRLMVKELDAAKASQPQFPALKYILMAGETLFSKDVKSWFEKVGTHAEIVNLYGTSETTLAKTFHRVKEVPPDAAEAIHVGKPIKDAFIVIVNDGALCRVDEIGEIYIKTPYMTNGYYNNPLLNEVSFVQNPLINDRVDIVHKTGDFGKYLKDRSVQYIGRLDDQVKINGVRVELNEIKLAVLEIPGIREVEIIAQKNSEHEVKLICYFTSEAIAEEALALLLRKHLSAQLMPAWFIRLKAFPLNINGKIDRKKLPRPDVLGINQESYEAPESDTEKKLERIWSEVLGLQRISRNISFFRIGGNSLRAMQVISRIFHEFNVSIKVNDVFLYPAINELAIVIDRMSLEQVVVIPLLPEKEYYQASHGQTRLWLLEQKHKSMTAYNISSAYMLEGSLDLVLLEKVFDTICHRHEALRTTFHFADGMLQQRIRPYEKGLCRIKQTDMSGQEGRYEYAAEWVHAAYTEPFHLSEGPLFRVKVLQLETQQYLLCLSMHHIISDDWSLKILAREFFGLYEAFSSNKENPLIPLTIQYKEYAAWQHQLLQGNSLRKHQEYWQERFREDTPLLKMPLDFNRPDVKTYQGAQVKRQLDAGLVRSLNLLAAKEDVTTFMLLLAGVNLLLYKYTKQTDIVTGAPMAGRPHKDLEGQIGFFVNVLPLRMNFNEEWSFTELLSEAKRRTMEAFEHQLYPFDRIVEELQVPVNAGRSPLFDVMITVQQVLSGESFYKSLESINIVDFETTDISSKCDLEFNFYEEPGNISLILHYSTDLFKQERIELMMDRFAVLLENACAFPGQRIRELVAQSDKGLHQPVEEDTQWNITL